MDRNDARAVSQDEGLCEAFGMALADVEGQVFAIEAGDLSAWDFGRATMGRPTAEGMEGSDA